MRTLSTPELRLAGFLGSLALAAALLLTLGPQPPASVSEYVYRVRVSDCRITTPQVATAFRISDDLLVSVAHPFRQVRSFHLDGPDGPEGEPLLADIVAVRTEADLAILRLREPTTSGAGRLRSEEIPKDQPVQLATFNGNGDLDLDDAHAIRRAWVTLDDEGRRRSIELRGVIVPGDSGAPVLYEGEIVGTIFATSRREARGWAVSLPEITALLDTLEADSEPLPIGCDIDER